MFTRHYCITILLVPWSGAETTMNLNLKRISASESRKPLDTVEKQSFFTPIATQMDETHVELVTRESKHGR